MGSLLLSLLNDAVDGFLNQYFKVFLHVTMRSLVY